MLRSLSTIFGYAIHSVDGELGAVQDFFFDDQTWTVRYLVIQTGSWLNQRHVLVSTSALGQPDWQRRVFPVSLTQEQIRNSPDVDTAKPVSRQEETAMSAYYGWPSYWNAQPLPLAMPELEVQPQPEERDAHLRSLREVLGYHVHCGDDNMGSADDFIADDGNWSIRWFLVALGPWLLRRWVLIGTSSIGSVCWANRQVRLNLSREQLEKSPEFDPWAAVNREHEVRLYDYYGRPLDWADPMSPPPVA